MAGLDERVAAALDSRKGAESDNEDELFDQLENDESALDAIRETRMQQLHEECVLVFSYVVLCRATGCEAWI
jgi:hypothetical protein